MLMPITDAFILPADVLVAPVASLPQTVRKRFQANDRDFVVTRMRSRAPSRVVSEELAALLESFRDPQTIVEAVIKYSKANALEPEEMLSQALPVLERFIHT